MASPLPPAKGRYPPRRYSRVPPSSSTPSSRTSSAPGAFLGIHQNLVPKKLRRFVKICGVFLFSNFLFLEFWNHQLPTEFLGQDPATPHGAARGLPCGGPRFLGPPLAPHARAVRVMPRPGQPPPPRRAIPAASREATSCFFSGAQGPHRGGGCPSASSD